MPTAFQKFLIVAGGVAGASGVAFSAVAAHVGGGNVGTAATFLLAHAPVLLIAGLIGRGRTITAGAAILLVGLVVFSGDLLMRPYVGDRLFPRAAPLGGTAMIAGWLVLAASAFTTRPKP